jgi:hypothetical protein
MSPQRVINTSAFPGMGTSSIIIVCNITKVRTMPTIDEINRSEWAKEDNWTSPGFYFSKQDTRWIVPKKNPVLGWTFNLGNKKGAWAMLISFMAPTILLLITFVFVAVMHSH